MVKSKHIMNAKKASDDGKVGKKSGGGTGAGTGTGTGTGGGGGGGRAGGLDEIDSLFATKKQSAREMQETMDREEEASRMERKRRKRARMEEEAEETALRGFCPTASSSSAPAGAAAGTKGRGGGDAAAPSNLHERATKLKSLTYTREDVERLNNKDGDDDDGKNGARGGEARDRWATDGHGGVFNGEGFTGRRDDGGHRVFKAHLMNRKGFGTSPDCPFDCDCCFI
jgi:hypothetical protein